MEESVGRRGWVRASSWASSPSGTGGMWTRGLSGWGDRSFPLAFSLDFHIGVSKRGSVLSLPHPVFCEAPSRMWVRIFQRNVCCLPAQNGYQQG